ncbi:hypothetical protein UFOVP978_48 [uncultured Caudovirales phage]|uniref:Uncharacterized protein n=1 Tax=uncultured Caudovirales phage TaxID=2100421 RepID=A0A6J5PXM8_9CAUD|nr:hypothetical protein UFOVP978_48 [uncultured Caudovirales phage]
MTTFTFKPGANAYSILHTAKKALAKAGASAEDFQKYYAEATSGDYAKLLRVTTELSDWLGTFEKGQSNDSKV